MGIRELIQQKREEILHIATQHGAYNVRIFGSVARGEASLENDIDFLVDMDPQHSLLDRISLLLDLEQLLGRKVDVATERILRPGIRERVLREAVSLTSGVSQHYAPGTNSSRGS